MGKHVVSAQQGCIRGPIGPKVRPSPRRVSSFHISQKRPLLSLSPPGSAKPFPSWLQGRTLKHSCHCREITTDSRPLKPLPALPHPAPLGPIVTPRSPPPPVAITQRASAVTCLCVCVCVCVAQLCTTLCHPMDCIDCSLSGSSVCRILQARILEQIAISFSRGSSQPRDRTRVSCMAGRFFTV